ncbi:2-keto-4-pentenoate hydratase/2-oxohepta-3-ene-1,7-dioic acid hydratase in catechol pathway [Nitrobacteraceae bacterium AZCC 2161]
MKLATYKSEAGDTLPGVISEDLKNVIGLGKDFADMLSLIDEGQPGLDVARKRLAEGSNSVPLASVQLLAPIPLPRQIRDFHNDAHHMSDIQNARMKLLARLAGQPEPVPIEKDKFEVPALFLRQPIYYIGSRYSVGGPDDEVQEPSFTDYFDYELELAAVVGRKGKNLSEKQARDHIFGYTIFNDFSTRDAQFTEMEARLGPTKSKCFDKGNVFGPWIVTRDEVPDPYKLKASSRVNGVLHCETDGRYFVNSFERMISYVSRDETLHPGEIFGSGTYGGGSGLEIDYFLKDGDVVELEIEKIGKLRNRVIGKKR